MIKLVQVSFYHFKRSGKMIYTKIFNFGSKILELRTLEPINLTLEDNINFLLNTFLHELNHNVSNSFAQKFNESQINIPINLESLFLDFLEFNIDYYLHFDFQPFDVDLKNNEKEKIREYFASDSQNEVLIKFKEVKLNTSFLRSSYIIEILKKFLEENKIHNFMIMLPDTISAVGIYTWEYQFNESEYFSDKTFQIKDANALLVENIEKKRGTKREEFEEVDNELKRDITPNYERFKNEEMILVGKDLSQLKLIKGEIVNLDSHKALDKAAKENEIDIIILNNKHQAGVFKGMPTSS